MLETALVVTQHGTVAAPLGMQAPASTIEDWIAIPEEERAELIDGHIVFHAFPGPKHGFSQGDLFAQLRPFGMRQGSGGGGGVKNALTRWWLSQEVDMEIGAIGCRPDVIGWRRDKHPKLPEVDSRGVCTAVPDFVCEVLSKSTARYDMGDKRTAYFQAGVGHYWIVDPEHRTLMVLKRAELGYVVALSAGFGEKVRAEPFDQVEIDVSELFMDDEEEVAPARASKAEAPAPAEPKRRAAPKRTVKAKPQTAAKKPPRR